jgi:lysophospholipase L1-like esterase
MKKILCIGDSLSLPGHLNKYEDTWIYKLKTEFPEIDFITFFKRQLTTEALVSMGGGAEGIDNLPKGADCLEFFEPQIVILQLGIVDCAPRLLKKHERIIVSKLPTFISKKYIDVIKKIRPRKITNTIVPPETFKKNLENYIQRSISCRVQKIIFLQIPYPDNSMISKNKQIEKNVSLYKNIIFDLQQSINKTHSNFITAIDPLDSRLYKEAIFEDGYHPNKKGHSLISNQLKTILLP